MRRFLTSTLAILAALGLGACNVQTVPIKGDKGDKGDKGVPGTPDVEAIAALQNAIAALQMKVVALDAKATSLQSKVDILEMQIVIPDCPAGYLKLAKPLVSANPDSVLCGRGDDQVVKVGGGNAAFWIDRYEASVWSNPDGTGNQYDGNYPQTFPTNGQVSDTSKLLYAVSKNNTTPAGAITWFQANLACLASGKRLPTWREWLLAAMGTKDPGPSNGSDGACLTSSIGKRSTGAGSACVSVWGAEDMIGNLQEAVDQWQTMIAGPDKSATWPDIEYGADATTGIGPSACLNGVNGGCSTLLAVPIAPWVGGHFSAGAGAGIFAIEADSSPASWTGAAGFRCLLSR